MNNDAYGIIVCKSLALHVVYEVLVCSMNPYNDQPLLITIMAINLISIDIMCTYFFFIIRDIYVVSRITPAKSGASTK